MANYSENFADIVRQEYNTHSGADITLFMAGVEIGTAMSISLSSDRVKQGVWTFGTVAPRAYGRGIRQIAGELENVSIKYSLVEQLLNSDFGEQHWIVKKMAEIGPAEGENATQDFYKEYTAADGDKWANKSAVEGYGADWQAVKPIYLDELLPLDIVCVAVNEFGSIAKMSILGAEFTSSIWAMTVQDTASIERCAFVARDYTPWSLVQSESTESDKSTADTINSGVSDTINT